MVPPLKHVVLGNAVIITGLLLLCSQMAYDAYILPPFLNGAYLSYTYSAGGACNDSRNYWHLRYNPADTVCGGSISCLNKIGQMAMTNTSYNMGILVNPVTWYQPNSLFAWSRYKITGISLIIIGVMTLIETALLITLFVYALLPPLVPINSSLVASWKKYLRWFTILLYLAIRIYLTVTYILYFLWLDRMSSLTGDALPGWLSSILITTATWYLVMMWYEVYISYLVLFIVKNRNQEPLYAPVNITDA